MVKGSFTQCGNGCGNGNINNWIPFCAATNDILCNVPLPLPHRMGSEPIYLWHHCRSRSSVNESISYNGIQLLRQYFLAIAATAAAPCERTLTSKKY